MAHYFDSEPVSVSNRKTIDYRVNGINFSFVTDSGVFCRDGVDFGSDLMINAVVSDMKTMKEKLSSASFLDLGCGVGVVGISVKGCFMKVDVTGVDVNRRAVALARENAVTNRTPCNFMENDGISGIDKTFDFIATNPPVRAGKATVFRFYEESFEHMKEGSCLYVVLQRKQGAPSTEKKLIELFGNCETLAISGGYRVMKAVKE